MVVVAVVAVVAAMAVPPLVLGTKLRYFKLPVWLVKLLDVETWKVHTDKYPLLAWATR